MAYYSEYKIEIEDDVYEALKKYCDKTGISISGFIKSNLFALGEY